MFKTLKTVLIVKKPDVRIGILFALSLGLSACGDSKSNSNSDYVYKNPDKGVPVKLKEASTVARLAEPTSPSPKKKVTRLYDGFFKVDLNTLNVSFRFKKDTPSGESLKTEEILLTGRLSKDQNGVNGWIDDAEAKKLKGSRAFAYVSCFPDNKGNVCARSYVSVRYADENGQEKEKQFHASPQSAVIKKRKEKEQADAEKEPTNGPTQSPPIIIVTQTDQKPPVIQMAPGPVSPPTQQSAPIQKPVITIESAIESKDSAIVTRIDEREFSIIEEKPEVEKPIRKSVVKPPKVKAQPKSKLPADVESDDSDEEDAEGTTHEEDDTDSGVYVTPQTPDELKTRLIGKKSAPSSAQTSAGQNGAVALSTFGLRLNLAQGGISKLTPEDGSIVNATLMPKSGAGFERRSEDSKAYASGFLVDFVQETARRFALDNPGCGTLRVNQLSLKRGGEFKPHNSHRNGLDIDLGFFNSPPGTRVVRYIPTVVINKKTGRKQTLNRATTKSNFDHLCFLKYLKFIDDQKFTNTGKSELEGSDIVDLVFVNVGVQAGLCQYVKDNNLSETYADAMNLVYPEVKHYSHFHLRLRCSPKHIGCLPKDLDRTRPFKKRGCR